MLPRVTVSEMLKGDREFEFDKRLIVPASPHRRRFPSYQRAI